MMVETIIVICNTTYNNCNKCEHRFTTQEDPKIHIKINHGDNELCCIQCEKKLKSKAELEDHIISQHQARNKTECI